MTMIDPHGPDIDAESQHHHEVVAGALAELSPQLKESLFAQPGIEDLLREGKWVMAKGQLSKRGMSTLAMLLDLATPDGLAL